MQHLYTFTLQMKLMSHVLKKGGGGAFRVMDFAARSAASSLSGFSLPFFRLRVCLSFTFLSEAESHPLTNSNISSAQPANCIYYSDSSQYFSPLLTLLSVPLSVECQASIHGSESSHCGPCSSLSIHTLKSFFAFLFSPACVRPV